MSNKSPLHRLLDLTQKQSNNSARKLGQLNCQYQEAEKKLNLLLQYRESYQTRLQNAVQDGIEHIEWRNFIIFINKLDAAIAEQRLSLKHAENNRDSGKNEYQSLQRKFNSYDTLSQRYQIVKKQKYKKNEQKELDEFTSNRYARKTLNITN